MRVVAHHHHVLMFGGEQIDEVGLDLVRVLVFVHEDELKLPPIKRRDLLVFLEHSKRLFEQIIEVERVGRFFPALVARVHIFDLLQERQEIGKLLREQFLDRSLRVDDETEDVRQHVALWKSDFLRVDSAARDH